MKFWNSLRPKPVTVTIELPEDYPRRLSQRAFANYQAAKTLELMGRDADARKHWQGCADDLRESLPDERHLSGNPLYMRAMEKLQ
ncbi:MAG: hypothetical protein JWL77_5720 [Chthonomonadaceae bacterium]|nr:hypothetical protein [Chthonomonadaceae bacterium]